MNYGNHNRDIIGKHGHFTDGEWNEFRDNCSSRRSDWVAPGKTIRPKHYRNPTLDETVEDAINVLESALRDGIGNKIDLHYRLGCAYAKAGDVDRAKMHFGKAADAGHGDAKEELAKLLGGTAAAANKEVEDKNVRQPTRRAEFRVKAFSLLEIIQANRKRGYLLLVDVGNYKGMQPLSVILRDKGAQSPLPDVYENEYEARSVGKILGKLDWTALVPKTR